MNFSNNRIGKRPHVHHSGEDSGTSSSTEGSINSSSVAVVRPNQDEGRAAAVATEGIEVWSVATYVQGVEMFLVFLVHLMEP